MRKLIPAAAAFALLLVVGSTTFATASSVSGARSLSLVAVDVPKSELYVDAGAKGDGPGDTMFFREVLREGGRKVGGSEVMCVFVGGDVGRCHGTLRLAAGTLEASGGVHFGGRFSLPVVGGTREYLGARGVLTVIEVDDKRSRYAIELAE